MRRLYLPLMNAVVAARASSTEPSLQELASSVSKIKDKLHRLEESRASNALLQLYASRKLKQMDIKQSLRVFADETYHSPIYCHENLPVILAHFVTGLDELPDGLNAMPSILLVRETLLSSFSKLVECEIPVSPEQAKRFVEVLEEIDDAHAERDLLQTMAVGLLELKDHISRHRKALVQLKHSSPKWAGIRLTEADVMPYEELADIQEPMNFCNRCMIMYNFFARMQMNLSLEKSDARRVGMVDLELDLERVVRNAVDEAREICNQHYGDCPDVKYYLPGLSKTYRFPSMSTTIRYIVVELMKNAFRATVESHMKRNSVGIVTCEDMPPVKVLINLKEGLEHACISVADQGMGMTRKSLEMAMAYSYTSVEKPAMTVDGDGSTAGRSVPSPLAGYGYGLPMSRVYARSLGGDLVLQSLEGFGTKAYYYIKLDK